MDVRKSLVVHGILLLLTGLLPGFGALRFCRYDDIGSTATMMYCENLTAESDLEDDLRSSTRFSVKQLVIANSSMRFFRHKSFLHTKFEVIHIKNCSLLSLSDSDVAFEGLEDHLQKLFISNSSMVNHLDWRQLRNLKNLHMLSIVGSDLDYVDNTLSTVACSMRLMSVRLTNNHISWIHSHAFSQLGHISSIRLGHNQIDNLQRSMFPNPPKDLSILDFSYNLLQNLPADLFSNMATLQMLNLEGNQIITIDEKVFGGIINQMIILSFRDNPLACDCRLKWLTKIELNSDKLRGKCSKPSSHKDKEVSELRSRDLWC